MEQEASDKLVGRDGHDFRPVPALAITPPKAHLPIPGGHEPVITARHTMRIAAQRGHDLLGRGQGGFGIDDPRLLPQRREETLQGLGISQRCRGPGTLEAALHRGAVQGREIFAAKHLGEGFDGKEEIAPLGGNPPGAIGDKAPPVTTQWTWRWSSRVWLQVCKTMLMPRSPPSHLSNT